MRRFTSLESCLGSSFIGFELAQVLTCLLEGPAQQKLSLVAHALHLQIGKIVHLIFAVIEQQKYSTCSRISSCYSVYFFKSLLYVERLLNVEVKGEEKNARACIQLEIFYDRVAGYFTATNYIGT